MARKTRPKTSTRAARKPKPRTKATAQVLAMVPQQRAEVKITAAKGRPMLTWVGKRPLRHVIAFPAQHVETFPPPSTASGRGDEFWRDWPNSYPRGGLLFHGDNKEVLAHLLANGFRGKVDLVYIDPPFDSGADYVRKVTLRGLKGTAKLDGESYTLGEQLQYTDIWANDNYLQFMYERLLLLKELMKETATIWLHCDHRRGHYLKCIMDEVFGGDRFINQIAWKRSDAHSDVGQGAKHFGAVHDILFLYSKADAFVWRDVFVPLSQATADAWYRNVDHETGRRYNKADITGPGGAVKGNPVYDWKGVVRAWRFSRERMEDLDRRNLLVYSDSGMPYLKRYLDESKGVPLQDFWDDIQMVRGIQRRGEDRFPTEKPQGLLQRIVTVGSDQGALILDCFIGSGTTAAVAQNMGRRWIACDINKGAIQMTSKRMQTTIREQIEQATKPVQAEFQGVGAAEKPPAPAQLSFAVYRVNDYDLAIQHVEAVNLACEHLGVERTRTDRYFDGTLGKRLTRIVPFNHPLTVIDLEELRREIEARPGEDRGIVLVCLGKEPAADGWVADWNQLRRGKQAVNRIEVIELRTDPKYGKFFKHESARARVRVRRERDGIVIDIQDFISPSIIERLADQAGLLKPKIDDWRAMVDCVLIDADYDGSVFNVTLSDVPERKSDLIQGRYAIPAAKPKQTVAVKIIDMLGEEVLATHEA
jgi:DNA modification methylase